MTEKTLADLVEVAFAHRATKASPKTMQFCFCKESFDSEIRPLLDILERMERAVRMASGLGVLPTKLHELCDEYDAIKEKLDV
jgi:hypothetical protein